MKARSKKEAKQLGATRYFTGKPCKHGHICDRSYPGGVCLQCNRVRSIRMRKENPERYKEGIRKWRERNWDYYYATQIEWRKKNRERYVSAKLAYKKRNPEQTASDNHSRIARMRKAEGKFTKADIKGLLLEQKGRCNFCDADLDKVQWHVDHIIPLSKGGTNWPHNLQILCWRCNTSKADKMPDEWAKKERK